MGKKSSDWSDKQATKEKRSIVNSCRTKETKEKEEKEEKIDDYTKILEERVEYLEKELEEVNKELYKSKKIIENIKPDEPYFGQMKYDADGDFLVFDGSDWVPTTSGCYGDMFYNM